MSEIPWCVLVISPGRDCESKAAEKLERAGFVTWLPKCQAFSRRNNPKGPVCPLFPNYLLMQLPRQEDWPFVFGYRGPHDEKVVTGVVQVLRRVGDTEPATLCPADVALLRELQGADGVIPIRSRRPGSWVRQGDRVRITNGNFAGLNSVVQKVDAADRISCLIDMLGGQREVQGFTAAQLVKLSGPVAHLTRSSGAA